MKIGIFGGSFDPVHNGHVALAEHFYEQLRLDKIIVIPALVAPHKTQLRTADAADRLNMCRLAFADERFEISDIEILRGGKSYTVDTLSYLHEKYPDSELYLIIGADMLLYFDKWFRWRDIADMAYICAAVRNDNPDEYELLRKYSFSALADIKERIILSGAKPFEVSSTGIREKIRSGESVEQLVPPEVAKYIKDGGLYADDCP
ncbi:MAG: nicotinate (nicotinamide) nucleotide adenylyltransferase [Clostridiales bacterium]|nr:nicotinate (nicotinamide) nucleotide adenylyltransferase [Clostridiales bacterium]